ncbi:MAG: NAD-binding protein [Solirubrobacterales bacterium]|nr:NAD-binding protein [Solirubrobacterales bacterium]
MTRRQVLILGDRQGLAAALARQLTERDIQPRVIYGGTDTELASTLSAGRWAAVVVLTHDDPLALRLTLLSAQVRPELPQWVTLFDRTIVHRFHQIMPSVNVVDAAVLVANALADRCVAALDKPRGSAGVRVVDDALRLMLLAGAGLIAILALQTVLTVLALREGVVDAIYYATRSLATVADVPHAEAGAVWFKLISTVTTIVSVALVAVFTAALVRRLSRARLTTVLGRRRAPARGHAVLVGFGQIGFRLALELRSRGVAMLALERDVDAPCVRLARRAGIPVAIGRGDDRATLELLGVHRCGVVAAVTSDDLTNVAIGLAATDVRPEVPLVLRLGDGNVAAETESLLHFGSVCDAHGLIAGHIAAEISSAFTTRPVL